MHLVTWEDKRIGVVQQAIEKGRRDLLLGIINTCNWMDH